MTLRPLALGPGHDHGFDLVADNDVTHVVGWISEYDDPYIAKFYWTNVILELRADTFEELKEQIREQGFELEHD